MKIKKVVKVMNFHSLLHVDSSRRKAEKYFKSEVELTKMIDKIVYNKNLILDKKTLKVKSNKPVLNIYIGNDYGFCGGFNSSINDTIKNDSDCYKIVIGKKIHNTDDKIILTITKDNFFVDFNKIEKIIYESIKSLSYSEINIIYNHYYNANSFAFIKKRLFPITFEKDKINNETYNDDFVVETDVNTMVLNLVTLYICYEIRIAETNSWAAENVMRQQVTRESLKKIDEIEEEKLKEERKVKKHLNFKKIIENFIRL
ncbi:MAG: F0F1 ATP synthase subunit gamma [Ignavibacteriales bacterium]